jgi:hypothetical protein
MSEAHDKEFHYLRGAGKRRHREVCHSNAKSDNQPIATMREPRCKMCERKLAAELKD